MFAKEKKGAELIIQKTDGNQVRGELIAVKENSLLLLERDSGADVSVGASDIKTITIVKKSKTGTYVWTLLPIGAVIGAAVSTCWRGGLVSDATLTTIGIAVGGISGILIGVIIGTAARNDEIIQFEDKLDSEIQEILEKLSKKARIPDYQ